MQSLAGAHTPLPTFPHLLSSPPTAADPRVLLIVSDIELGPPGIDPFPHDDFISELFASYTQPPYDEIRVDLVLNGDIFDLLKVGFDNEYPRYIDEELALRKLDVLLEYHPGFIHGLRTFLEHPSGNKHAHYIVGNHDPEILFQGVQNKLRQALGPCGERLHFPGFSMRIGPVHIEHGHQLDAAFAQDPNDLFATWQDRTILRLPWCTYAVMDSLFPLSPTFFLYENLRPRPLMLERMPIAHEVLSAAFARYWSRTYIPESLLHRKDPTRGVSFTMARQIIYRTMSNDIDAGADESKVLDLFMSDHTLELVALGHLHHPSWKMYGTRTLLRTGCMRDEFEITRHGNSATPIDKSYAEILLDGEHLLDNRLFRVPSPSPPLENLYEINDEMLALARALNIRTYMTPEDTGEPPRRLSKVFGWLRRPKDKTDDAPQDDTDTQDHTEPSDPNTA